MESRLFEYAILGFPDTFRRTSSEFKYRSYWHSVVGGDKDGELVYMTAPDPLCSNKQINPKKWQQIWRDWIFWHLITIYSFKKVVKVVNHCVTKLSPFVIEKCIKSCAGEVNNVTKLKSSGLIIECQRKQQSLNLLSHKQIHNITISSTHYRTLNTSRRIIRYRDEDFDDLSDDEICEELAPRGVIDVKRFITKRNGPLVKLSTFLLHLIFPLSYHWYA